MSLCAHQIDLAPTFWTPFYSLTDGSHSTSFSSRVHDCSFPLVIIVALLAGEGEMTVLAEKVPSGIRADPWLLASVTGFVADVLPLVVVPLAAEVAGV